MTDTKRMFYLDNLRVAVIILVIAHHVGQAYGPTGGWWPIQEEARSALLGPFFTVNRSFFMSLFFMVSGYFTVMSFRSKGGRAFLKDRSLRLGIPTLVFGLIMIPMQLFVFAADGDTRSVFPIDVGHLWFLEHLLIFSAGYVLWQTLRGNRVRAEQSPEKSPGYLSILIVALALALVTGVVRIWYPIDKWVYLLGFIRVAFADVPRDLTFFIIGGILEPASERGQIMLMKGRDLWVFMPNVSQPIRLGLAQRLTGEVANGDLARANFSGDYMPQLLRTERIEGEEDYVLELAAVDRGVTYHRVLLWVDKNTYRPRKAEFYSLSNRLMKTCSYEDFREMAGKRRPTQLIMEDALRPGERSVLRYERMRLRDLPDKIFSKDYLKKLQ